MLHHHTPDTTLTDLHPAPHLPDLTSLLVVKAIEPARQDMTQLPLNFVATRSGGDLSCSSRFNPERVFSFAMPNFAIKPAMLSFKPSPLSNHYQAI